MASSATTQHTSATPAQIWSVLSNGWRYPEWVQGARDIRDVDEGWPTEGASIHFSVGVGPLRFNDKTTSRTCVPEQQLELEAHARPFGTARINLVIGSSRDGSVVTMDEHPMRGPAAWLHNPLVALGFRRRVTLMLDELVRLAEAEPVHDDGG